jgi:hypothetical protein
MSRKELSDDVIRARVFAGEANLLARDAAKLLAAVRSTHTETKALTPFPLDAYERTAVAELAALGKELRKKLSGRARKFTAAEGLTIVTAVAESLLGGERERRQRMLWAARQILYGVHRDVLVPVWRAEARKRKPTGFLYQLRVKLLGAKPAIWRRIQVKDCTLDKLHEHIQTSMGWTNSHLHHFDVNGDLYADPELMEDDFHNMNYRDSTITLLSAILPDDHRRYRFRYRYDFGDSWDHEILFEGCPKLEKGRKYPLCVEGERACPPEDVGGTSRYAKFLETIADRESMGRTDMLEWADGWFDPDEFDAAIATKSMSKGLPDWRKAETGERQE